VVRPRARARGYEKALKRGITAQSIVVPLPSGLFLALAGLAPIPLVRYWRKTRMG
jgi:hypothetical protein